MDKPPEPADIQDTAEAHWKRFQEATRKVLTTPKPDKQQPEQKQPVQDCKSK
jgi:hypothetical protein